MCIRDSFNAAQQAANTTTIDVGTRLPALRIPGLRAVLDALQAQVEAVHGGEVEWIRGHFLNQVTSRYMTISRCIVTTQPVHTSVHTSSTSRRR